MLRRHRLVVLPLLALAARTAGAQSLADFRACGVEPESTTAVLAVRVQARDATSRVPPAWSDTLAARIARRLVVPAPLVFARFVNVDEGGERYLYLGGESRYDATLVGAGERPAARVVSTSMPASLDSAALLAIGAALAEVRASEVPMGERGDGLAMRVTLRTRGAAGAGWLPVVTVATRRARVERRVRVLEAPRPRYPTFLRKDGIEGRATLEFVVGADGRVQSPTVRVVEATDRAFGLSAVEAAVATRFEPARAQGCDVPTLVRQPYQFALDDGDGPERRW